MRQNLYLSVLLLVMITGCSVAFQDYYADQLAGIELQMTTDQVRRVLGKPQEVRQVNILGTEYESWRYEIRNLWRGKYNELDASYYELLFQDGVLTQWNKSKVYANPHHELKELKKPEGIMKTYDIKIGKVERSEEKF